MRKRQRPLDEDWAIWEEFWAVLTSELAERQFATGSHALRPATRTSTAQTPVLTVPEMVVTISTTIYSTAFVTVPAPGGVTSGFAAGSSSAQTSGLAIGSSAGQTSSDLLQSTASTTSVASLVTVLPSIVTDIPTTSSSAIISSTSSTAALAASTDVASADGGKQGSHKQAIVGGLSGTIAGLVFIGVLICVILRLRRRKQERQMNDSTDSLSEKGFRPAFARTWTGFTSGAGNVGSPKQPTEVAETVSHVTVDEDHRIIRMNTRHWPRPYAPGEGEGWRDSMPAGQLRVVNPDLSRPDTPRRSSETASNFLKRQRSAFTGFVLGANRSLSSAQSHAHPSFRADIPTITVVDPALSREWTAAHIRTPSFRSYPSVSSLPIVVQQPPEDPFCTPSSEANTQLGHDPQRFEHWEPSILNSSTTARPQRPSLAALQSAAGAAGRTWSQVSCRLLYPLRNQTDHNSSDTRQVRGLSHFSYSTNASRASRRSDPFDLDRSSLRGSFPPESRAASEFKRKSGNSNWILYEGT